VVVAVALLDGSGRVLMQKRSLEGVHPGVWEFPGGKLEKGESLRGAAIREIREELAVTIDPVDLEPLTFADGESAGEEVVILLYTCQRWRGTPTCLSGEEVAWYRVDELPGLDMPPLDYPLAERLAGMLGRGSA
jgi:8-oxo-dGTP diphosphatase